jgi:hypothetical protein
MAKVKQRLETANCMMERSWADISAVALACYLAVRVIWTIDGGNMENEGRTVLAWQVRPEIAQLVGRLCTQ